MAKVAQTIAGIALVALAIVGSVFIPGVGGFIISGALRSIAFGLGASLTQRGVTGFFIKKPPAIKDISRRGTTGQDPIAPRRVIYGAVKLGGNASFKSFAGQGYGGTGDVTLFLVVTLSGKRVHAINNLYMNGNYTHLNGSGDADDEYAGLVHAEYNLGTDTQSAFAGLIADSNGLWTADHKQLGCAGAYLKVLVEKDPFNGSVPNPTFDVNGCRVFDPRDDAQDADDPETWVFSRNAVLIIADFLRDPTGYGVDYADIDEGALIAGANLSDESVSLAATTGFSGTGINDALFSGTYTGSPNPGTFAARISVSGAPDSFQWQENGGAWSGDVIITGSSQSLADGISITFVNTTGHTVGDITNTRVGTEPRYCIDGSYDTTEDPGAVLNDMCDAMAGRTYYVGGKWVILPGAYRTPYPDSLTEDDFTESIKVTTKISRKDLINAVKGTYIPDNASQETSFPPYLGDLYIALDGEKIYKDVTFRFTKSSSACQRIAKIMVERNRRQVTIITSTKLAGYETEPGDTRKISFSRYGYSDKTFEVVGVQLSGKQVEGSPVITIGHTLSETDENAYSWNGSEEIVPPLNPDANVSPIPIKEASDITLIADPSGILAVGVDTDPSIEYSGMDIMFIIDPITQRQGASCLLNGAILSGTTSINIDNVVGLVVGSVINFEKEILTITGPGALGDAIASSATVTVARGQSLSTPAAHADDTPGYPITGTTTYPYEFPPGYWAAVPIVARVKSLFAVLRPGAMRIVYCKVRMKVGDRKSVGFDKAFQVDPNSTHGETPGIVGMPGALPGIRCYDGNKNSITVGGPAYVSDSVDDDLGFADGTVLGPTQALVSVAPGTQDLQFRIDTRRISDDTLVFTGGTVAIAAGSTSNVDIFSGTAGGNMNDYKFRLVILQTGVDSSPGINFAILIPS